LSMRDPQQSLRQAHFGQFMERNGTRLGLALGLTLGLVVCEAVAGLYANSLALLTDAAHNLTDVLALGLSWYAIRLTTQPADSQKTYGYHRVGILAAMVNSATLAFVALWVFYESYRRLNDPPQVRSQVLIFVGVFALVLNLLTAMLVRRGSKADLNLRSVFLHLMGDVASTGGAIIAGIAILFTGANWLDPVVGLLIGLAIAYNAWGILQATVDILLESSPHDIDLQAMVRAMLRIDGVLGVHDLHVWSLTQSLRTMSAHVLTEDLAISAGARIQREVSELVAQEFNIAHATLQLECIGCDADALFCDIQGHLQPVRRASPSD
jgi:cobalt-zinc-cadmium efflux system protein